MDKKEIIKLLKLDIREKLRDCWNYHKPLLKEAGYEGKFCYANVDNFINDLYHTDWEDVAWINGFIAGCENAIGYTSKLPEKEIKK
jgi:hypothetical protein